MCQTPLKSHNEIEVALNGNIFLPETLRQIVAYLESVVSN
jgi:hypothetical protein